MSDVSVSLEGMAAVTVEAAPLLIRRSIRPSASEVSFQSEDPVASMVVSSNTALNEPRCLMVLKTMRDPFGTPAARRRQA